MSDKLTQEKLESLIAELLQEEQNRLDEFKISINNTPGSVAATKKKIGIKSNPAVGKKTSLEVVDMIDALIGQDKNDKDLSDQDLTKAFSYGPSATDAVEKDAYDLADYLATSGKVANIKNAAKAARTGSPPPPTKNPPTAAQLTFINSSTAALGGASAKTTALTTDQGKLQNLLNTLDWSGHTTEESAAQTAISKYTGLTGPGSWAHGATYPDPKDLTRKNSTILSITKIRNEMIAALNANDFTAADDYALFITNNSGPGKLLKKISSKTQAKLDKVTGRSGNGLIARTVMKILNADIDFQSRKRVQTQVFGDIESSFRGSDLSSDQDPSVMNPASIAGESSMDSSLIAQFSTLSGGDPIQAFATLAQTADDIAKGKFPTDPNEALAFTSKVNLLNYFANLSKLQGGPEGGYHFERFLVGLTRGAQIGGKGGAIDVIQNAKAGIGATSQKFTASSSFTQAIGTATNDAGVRGVLQNSQFPGGVFYFVGKKIGGAAAYDTIEVYIIQLSLTGTNNYNATWWEVDSNGNIVAQSGKANVTAVAPGTGKNKFKNKPVSYTNGSNLSARTASVHIDATHGKPAFTIPVLKNPSGTSTAVAEYLKDQMSGAGTGVFKTIKDNISNVYARLDNMEKNTMEYAAVKGGGTGKKTNPENYIQQIATDYTDIKAEWNTVFSTAKSTTRITESKLQTIDDLIAETMRDIKRKRKK